MKISLISRIRKRWIFKFYSIRLFFISSKKKRLFIDCGSNIGQGFTFFSKYFPNRFYDYILIEPNPNCVITLKEKYSNIENLEIIEAAVWTEEGTLDLFGLVEDERGSKSDGASIVSTHNTVFYEADSTKATKVSTIDFAALLKSKLHYDEIIIKMDIESSEYDVLEKLIKEDLFNNVRFIFIEFHSQFMVGEEKALIEKRERKIKQYLNNIHKLYIWH
ncbi:FkbM family methyltransferase [Kiloniella laminariae]|uniref:FkbM family methyltransferase n=1 Tax=Kiloniella laminariae TaxID=454162 RepID=A0ABT4LIX7_9PROT|nr:FkbM family methyltransferase [Kiloniella laminariae]MCZ4281062.1 FkbM family methyltransferase [Kiloniella laminariae]